MNAFARLAYRAAKLLAGAAGAVSLTFAPLPGSAHENELETLDFSKAPAGVLPWGYLAKVGVRYVDDRVVPLFLPPVLALDKTRVTLYGYMTPVEPGPVQRRFLLSWRPIFCAGCERPIGPEGIVEVNVLRPVPSTRQPLAVRGELRVLQNDPMNVLYRLLDATVVTRPEGRQSRASASARARKEASARSPLAPLARGAGPSAPAR